MALKKGNRIRSKGIQDVRIFPVPSHCNLLNTIDIQFRGVRDRARGVGGSTGVLPGVGVVDTGYNQHAGSPAQHGRGDAGPRVQFCALEAPSDGDWHVSMGDSAGQLSKCSRIHDIGERKWSNLWWL